MSSSFYSSETLAETYHSLRDTRRTPIFAHKRQSNYVLAAICAAVVLTLVVAPTYASNRCVLPLDGTFATCSK
jgi:hypothetical protein